MIECRFSALANEKLRLEAQNQQIASNFLDKSVTTAFSDWCATQTFVILATVTIEGSFFMTIVLTQKLGKLALITIATVLLNGIPLLQVHAQANNYKTIKIRLKTPGSNQEWLRIEVNGNTVKPIYTIRTNRNFSGVVNSALGVVSPVPLPSVRFDKWLDAQTTRVIFEPESCLSQQPQPTENSIQTSQPFCLPSCAIVGTDSVLLPEGTDIHQGRFTIEYTEGELIRTITFKIPSQD